MFGSLTACVRARARVRACARARETREYVPKLGWLTG